MAEMIEAKPIGNLPILFQISTGYVFLLTGFLKNIGSIKVGGMYNAVQYDNTAEKFSRAT